MTMAKIVHFHIEKVGGTTVKSRYLKTYGADNVWGYSSSERHKPKHYRSLGKKFFDIEDLRQRQIREWLFRETPQLAHLGQWLLNALPGHKAVTLEEAAEVANIIIGHFTVDEVTGMLDTREWQYRTVLRHPLERMRSHYYYLQQRAVPASRMRLPWLTAEGIGFEEFALQPAVQDYQMQVVGSCPKDYALIGVMDYLDAFMWEAGLQPQGVTAPVINKGTKRANTRLSPGFVREFEAFHAGDYELYWHMHEQWRPTRVVLA